MKKISFLIWNTKKCGGNKVVFDYARWFFNHGYEVLIFCVFGKNEDWAGVNKLIRPIWSLDLFRVRDVVVATFWPTAYLSLLLPAKKKFYFVLGWEPVFYKIRIISLIVSFTYKLPLKLIVISEFLQHQLSLFSARSSTISPLYIDNRFFNRHKAGKKKNVRKKILCVVSSYQYYKGVDNLISSIKILKNIYGRKLKFVLISFEKKSLSPLFDEFISSASFEKLVEEYWTSDLFFSSSRTEGFYLPALEAMACGCPVLMTDSGGVREYAKNGYNCILYKDAEYMLENNLLEKILNNDMLRRKLIRNGLKTARRFTLEKAVKRMEEILVDQRGGDQRGPTRLNLVLLGNI